MKTMRRFILIVMLVLCVSPMAYAKPRIKNARVKKVVEYTLRLANSGQKMRSLFHNVRQSLNKDDSVSAYWTLGSIYFFGHSLDEGDVANTTAPDYAKAKEWLEIAAKEGHPQSKVLLANMYEEGLGVTPDLDHAQDLRAEAASLGVFDDRWGSGFFINNHHIVTNKHVVLGCRELTVSKGGDSYSYPATVKALSNSEDLAVIQSNMTSPYYAVLQHNPAIPASSAVYLGGYSTKEFKYTSSFVINPLSDVSLRVPGSNARHLARRIKFAQLDDIQKGDSGSALFDQSGFVVGIMDSSDYGITYATRNQKGANAIPTAVLKHFLQSKRIPFYSASHSGSYTPPKQGFAPYAETFSVMIECRK